MTTDPSGDAIVSVLRAYRFRWADEADLQAGVHGALTASGYNPEREVRLSARDRIDVLVGTIGIEVKVARPGSVAPAERVTTQLQRYAAHEQITELILVTTTVRHKRVPDQVGGVPVHVVVVGGLR